MSDVPAVPLSEAPPQDALIKRMHIVIAETKRWVDGDKVLRAYDKLDYLAGLIDSFSASRSATQDAPPRMNREHLLRLAHRISDIARGNDDLVDPAHDPATCEVCGKIADLLVEFFSPDPDLFASLHADAMSLAYDEANEWQGHCSNGYKANLLAIRIEELVLAEVARLRASGATVKPHGNSKLRVYVCEGCDETREHRGQPPRWVECGTSTKAMPEHRTAAWCQRCATDGTLSREVRSRVEVGRAWRARLRASEGAP